MKAQAKLPYLALAYRVPVLREVGEDSEPYALEILSGVLDGHAAARLNQSLVRESRLATEVGTGYGAISRGPGLFLIEATPSEGKNVLELEQGIRQEIARVQHDGVSEDELQRVKAQVSRQPGLPARFDVLPGHADRPNGKRGAFLAR